MLWDKISEKIRFFFVKEKNLIDHWFDFDERLRFGFLASVNMLFRYFLFVVLGIVFSTLHYQIILLIMWLLSSLVAFYSYKVLVFQSEGSHVREYMKCLLIWALSYVINAAVLNILVEKLFWNVYFAQVIAIGFLFIINYLLFKHFAFKQERVMTRWEKFLSLFDVLGK